jgi:hypothetical protein
MGMHMLKRGFDHNITMATTRGLYRGNAATTQPRFRPLHILTSPHVEPLRGIRQDELSSLSPEIQFMVLRARAHYAALGAEDIYNHACQVLRAAVRGKLILPSTNGADPFSKQVAELILYHSLDSMSHLPNITFSPDFEKRFLLQRRFKELDGSPEERSDEYARLLNDKSMDLTDLLVVLYARIADMMTVHDPATVKAASTRMPGIFPVHESWEKVKTAWAWPMLHIYCPIADWGSLTTAYREMRDNAISYLYPSEVAQLSKEVEKRMPALQNTQRILYGVLNRMSAVLGVRVLVTTDSQAVSEGLSQLDDESVVVRIKPFKGEGGLINKALKRGVPVDTVHDWAGATIITAGDDLMYEAVTFLYNGGIKAAATAAGVKELLTLPPVDYVNDPKPITLYQSVHIDTVTRDRNMVPLELIFRTARMHMNADAGTAGHDVYKLCPLNNGERARFMQRLAEIESAVLPFQSQMQRTGSGLYVPASNVSTSVLSAA